MNFTRIIKLHGTRLSRDLLQIATANRHTTVQYNNELSNWWSKWTLIACSQHLPTYWSVRGFHRDGVSSRVSSRVWGSSDSSGVHWNTVFRKAPLITRKRFRIAKPRFGNSHRPAAPLPEDAGVKRGCLCQWVVEFGNCVFCAKYESDANSAISSSGTLYTGLWCSAALLNEIPECTGRGQTLLAPKESWWERP